MVTWVAKPTKTLKRKKHVKKKQKRHIEIAKEAYGLGECLKKKKKKVNRRWWYGLLPKTHRQRWHCEQEQVRGCLVFFFFFFFSSLITHYLKYLNFLYPPIWHTSLNFSSLNFFYFFVGATPEHNVKPRLAYLCNILGLKGHFTLFFPFNPYILPEPSTNPVKPPAQSSPSSSATASSLSSSSMASSSSAWSLFTLIVSSKPLARWGKDEICAFLGSSSTASSTTSSSSSSLFWFVGFSFFFPSLYP